jgi:hypothetical protein
MRVVFSCWTYLWAYLLPTPNSLRNTWNFKFLNISYNLLQSHSLHTRLTNKLPGNMGGIVCTFYVVELNLTKFSGTLKRKMAVKSFKKSFRMGRRKRAFFERDWVIRKLIGSCVLPVLLASWQWLAKTLTYTAKTRNTTLPTIKNGLVFKLYTNKFEIMLHLDRHIVSTDT